MKLLLVAMSNSIHTARWIRVIADQGWDVHVFPSVDLGQSHEDLRGVTLHHSVFGRSGKIGHHVHARGLNVLDLRIAAAARLAIQTWQTDYRVRQLARLIDRLRPDVVHSMEFQAGGYLTLDAKARTRRPFPRWIATNWGSDLYLFGRLNAHRDRITRVLTGCDFYSCECHRDIAMARDMGLRGEVLPVLPNSGGFDFEEIRRAKVGGPPSQRKLILLKGYQHWAGRALVGLRALERCADALGGYTVVVHSADADVAMAAELMAVKTGIDLVVLPKGLSHARILEYHGRSRISIGLSIGDGISTSFLEAMAMGAFPIQSDTSCGDEWTEHGRTALRVPPEDPDVVEAAIRRALADDELVDRAAERNWVTVQERLDIAKVRVAAAGMYERVLRR